MMNISKITKVLSLAIATTAIIFVSGVMLEASAQRRDPFAKAPYNRKTNTSNRGNTKPSTGNVPRTGNSNAVSKPEKPKGPQVVPAPAIEARIDYYKRVREEAAMNGMVLPKVTSVLLVNEMSVTGIFKTPRGYAAIVEAEPIKLSYTIYPGEKFFDGQLVAIEENRLVFRKVTKWSNNKFVSSVENKPLRKYTLQQEIQGTTPTTETYTPSTQSGQTQSADSSDPKADADQPAPGVIVSPLEEMKNQPTETETDSAGKSEKNKKGKKRASKRRKGS